LFAGALALAAIVYCLTLPEGLPWNVSIRDAAVGRGPFYARYVFEMFYGNVLAATVTCTAVAAGLLAAVVNRYLGWKVAAGAALVWIFLPPVWNRAVTGERFVCLASLGIAALWTVNAVALVVTKKARNRPKAMPLPEGEDGIDSPMRISAWQVRVNAIAGWIALGAACLFAIVSCTLRDPLLGEVASAFARGIVEEADGRIIVMDGACDEQIVCELGSRNEEVGMMDGLRSVSLRNDDAYRADLLARVKSAFPTETNLWVAANIGARAYAERAVAAHPERFYLMNGNSMTLKGWERRWEAFALYLKSSDRFVPVARRHFAYEGNVLANRLADRRAGSKSVKRRQHAERQAWNLYRRLYKEVDPGNFSALINMNELIRRGFDPGSENKAMVRRDLERFLRDKANRALAPELVQACGPIRRDPELWAKLEAEAKARQSAQGKASGGKKGRDGLQTLSHWNSDMIQAMNDHEIDKAARIARAILAKPEGRGSLPANAVMGLSAAQAGDYVASEAFLRTATAATNGVPPLLLNEYADTLMHLGRLDEAEAWARRAVREAPKDHWFARLTLAQVLEKKIEKGEESDETDDETLEKMRVEATDLLRRLAGTCPQECEARVRDMLRRVQEL